ncbi:hypothetical protein ACIRL2_26830 [Embleya sp. NPDC127516]|uniref:hypothetical protein n=1 Tax=Embleya sp. NPDC127516 TaxID=3363990 RepID=UPI003803A650
MSSAADASPLGPDELVVRQCAVPVQDGEPGEFVEHRRAVRPPRGGWFPSVLPRSRGRGNRGGDGVAQRIDERVRPGEVLPTVRTADGDDLEYVPGEL